MAYWERRTQAIVQLLMDKGILTAEEVRRSIEKIEQTTPMLGAGSLPAPGRTPPSRPAC